MAAGGRPVTGQRAGIVAALLLAQLAAATARADGDDDDPKRRVAVLEYRAGSAELRSTSCEPSSLTPV